MELITHDLLQAACSAMAISASARGVSHRSAGSVPRCFCRTRIRGAPTQAQQRGDQGDDDEDNLSWVRNERARAAQQQSEKSDLPFGVYLFSCLISAIVTVGSLFEFANAKPVFNVIQPDSNLWLPILAIFVVLGAPTTVLCGVRGVQAANAEFERLDRLDGEK